MNRLSQQKQILVLNLLSEGNSIRSIERMTGINRNTVMTLLKNAGKKAMQIHNDLVVNVKSNYVQCDEIWAYVGCKQKNLTMDERYYEKTEKGDQYTFVSMDSETKLVINYLVGKRNAENTLMFISELDKRTINEFQLSTDSFKSYFHAVKNVFRNDIKYGQIHKSYSHNNGNEYKYSPSPLTSVNIFPLINDPDKKRISTSHIERQNLTMRMNMRRFTRLTNAFSKKLDNLKYAVALHFFYYNFIREHKTIKVTPAMASNVTNTFWSWEKFLNYGENLKKVA